MLRINSPDGIAQTRITLPSVATSRLFGENAECDPPRAREESVVRSRSNDRFVVASQMTVFRLLSMVRNHLPSGETFASPVDSASSVVSTCSFARIVEVFGDTAGFTESIAPVAGGRRTQT